MSPLWGIGFAVGWGLLWWGPGWGRRLYWGVRHRLWDRREHRRANDIMRALDGFDVVYVHPNTSAAAEAVLLDMGVYVRITDALAAEDYAALVPEDHAHLEGTIGSR